MPEGPDLDRLWREHGGAVVAYLLRRTRNIEESRDLAQEVFVVAVRRGDKIPAGRERPWLYNVAHHVVGDWLRHQDRTRHALTRVGNDLVVDEPAGDPMADRVASAAELREVLQLLVQELKPSDQEVLILAAWEGLSGKDLAVALGCPVGAAKFRLAAARRRLAAARRRRGFHAGRPVATAKKSEQSLASGRGIEMLGEQR